MDKKTKAEPVKVLFDDMDAVGEIARDLISKEHTHLATARMRYVCRSKCSKRGGEPISGNIYKMGGKWEFLVGCDFVVEVALDVWNCLLPNQRLALVDHLLTRCAGEEGEDGAMKWKVRPPPVQEFPEVVARNGTWNEGLVSMKEGFRR